MTDLVFLQDNQALTTSRIVAEYFEKQHQHVMRDIRDIIAQAGDASKIGLMFHEATYEDAYGRDKPMFTMNRDGFNLLAMGFTGAKALQFKLKFIAAFNAMEQQLKVVLPSGDPREVFTPTVLRQLANHIESLESQVAELKPDAEYCRNVLQSPDTMPITLIAKEYGLSGETLNKILVEAKLIRKVGKTYVLNQPYAAMGYAETETILTRGGIRKMLKWTEKGRHLIHKILQGKLATNRERIYANPELF